MTPGNNDRWWSAPSCRACGAGRRPGRVRYCRVHGRRFPVRVPSGSSPAGESGALARRSGRLLNEVSHSQIVGARSLLTKATHSVSSGYAQHAEQFIDRAAQMPYDPREEGSPGVRAASMLVSRQVVDQSEASAPEDTTWLDVRLAVHRHLDPTGRAEVASVAHGFVLQGAFFTLTPAEAQRIQQSFDDAPLEADLGDSPDATVEQRRGIIRSLVMAAVALADAYTEASETGRPTPIWRPSLTEDLAIDTWATAGSPAPGSPHRMGIAASLLRTPHRAPAPSYAPQGEGHPRHQPGRGGRSTTRGLRSEPGAPPVQP
jgi:hypothetical protein